jgi:hypothetical protein
MQTINPYPQQTYFDIAIQYYGSVVYATDIAHANNSSITDDITGPIVLPDIDTTDEDKKVVRELAKLNINLTSQNPQ